MEKIKKNTFKDFKLKKPIKENSLNIGVFKICMYKDKHNDR